MSPLTWSTMDATGSNHFEFQVIFNQFPSHSCPKRHVYQCIHPNLCDFLTVNKHRRYVVNDTQVEDGVESFRAHSFGRQPITPFVERPNVGAQRISATHFQEFTGIVVHSFLPFFDVELQSCIELFYLNSYLSKFNQFFNSIHCYIASCYMAYY